MGRVWGLRTISLTLGILGILAFVALRCSSGIEPGEGAAGTIERAHAERRSGVMVQFEGDVVRTLSDDTEGSRHQRFIVELASGHTVLIAHNIDLAPRVPLQRGDRLEVRGEYEWNERGGVVHWTHHDPGGGRPGGWVRHRGQTYR